MDKKAILDEICEWAKGELFDGDNYLPEKLRKKLNKILANHENEWISVEDKLPKDGRDLYVYKPEWGAVVRFDRVKDIGAWLEYHGITHWMYRPALPEPPEDE